LYEAKLIIRGQKVGAQNGATYSRMHTASEEVATIAAAASRRDAHEAANSAASAFPQWSQTSDDERSRILNKAADLLLERADQFVEVIASEIGGSELWARFNCELAADIFRHAAGLTGFRRETRREGRDKSVQSSLVRQPAGVVLGIAPWNAPVVLASRAIAIPLACGNTVVLKAAERCPKTHSMVIEALIDAGLPKGAANLVTNSPDSASEIVETLVKHVAVRRVNFTGSTRVGRVIAEICARHLKPVVLELSGKAALIVLEDADLDQAVKAAAFGAFFNQGQICISTELVFVDESIADDFVARLTEKARSLTVGDPSKGVFDLGTMISADAAIRVRNLVDEAVERGAVLKTGAEISKTSMLPTVIDHVDSSMKIYREESFGPVAAVVRVRGEEEAISLANDSSYGLACAVFSKDIAQAKAVAARLECGICHINGPTVYDDPSMPFGGIKDSGYGKLGGDEAVYDFTELKWVAIHQPVESYKI
jgi:acyl-CoA reductase-like NAD-dependent aldehyde dehydrogenase